MAPSKPAMARVVVSPEAKNSTLAFCHFKKTRMCCFFQSGGTCLYGDQCNFAHGEEELQEKVSLSKTSLCQAFMNGKCPLLSAQCRFAHGKRELRRVCPQGQETVPKGKVRRGHRRKSKMASPEEVPKAPGPCHFQVDTQSSLPVMEPFDNSEDEAEDEAFPSDTAGQWSERRTDTTLPWEGKAMQPSLWDASTCSSLPTLDPEDNEELPQKRPTTPARDCEANIAAGAGAKAPPNTAPWAAPYVREMGNKALPAFFWQGQVFLGDPSEVLRLAQPDFYED